MNFLLEYDRLKGRLVRLVAFADSDRTAADDARLRLEIELSRQSISHEVVVLEAPSEEALRRTHSRYFVDIEELVEQGTGRSSAG